jgi:hypothetical protein
MFMHEKCRNKYLPYTYHRVSRDGKSLARLQHAPIKAGLYFYGFSYSGLFNTSPISAEVALKKQSKLFWSHLKHALNAAQHAERHSFYKTFLRKRRFIVRVSPYTRVDVFSLFRRVIGNDLYQLSDPVGTLTDACAKLSDIASAMQRWYQREVRPKVGSKQKCWLQFKRRPNQTDDILWSILKMDAERAIKTYL